MKRTILVILVSWMTAHAIHAQFNTIGDVQNKKVMKRESPSEQVDAQNDSVQEVDTITSTPKTEAEGKGEVVSNYMSVSLPLKKIQINSKFGMRMHPICHRYIMHNGIDLHARHEDVLSILPGRVIRVGDDSRSGKFVTVQSANYTVSYCHLSRQYVRQNDFVSAGQPLGLTGRTGAATGEHLHLTTKKDGKAFNPVILLNLVQSIKNRCLSMQVYDLSTTNLL